MPILDINIIPTNNSTTIAVGDNSSYGSGFTIDSPTLEITVPGFPTVATQFTANSLNVYNTQSIGITSVGDCLLGLPDGVWVFKYSVYPNFKYFTELTYLKTDQLEEKYYNTFLYVDITKCDSDFKLDIKKKLDNIRIYIEGAKAAASKCNRKLSIDLYTLADRKLDQLNKNISCGV